MFHLKNRWLCGTIARAGSIWPIARLMIAATGVDESSLHYRGWRVVLACFLMAFFMFGFGLYGQGVYLAELQRAHGWPGTLVSAASTFSFLLTSVARHLHRRSARPHRAARADPVRPVGARRFDGAAGADADALAALSRLCADVGRLDRHGHRGDRDRARTHGSSGAAGSRSASPTTARPAAASSSCRCCCR